MQVIVKRLILIAFGSTLWMLFQSSVEARPGKTCIWDGVRSEAIDGFDCHLQRGSFTYSSHSLPYIYIPDCSSPKSSYVISGFDNGGRCPDSACEKELSNLIWKVCR